MAKVFDNRSDANNQPLIGWRNIALDKAVTATSAAAGFPAIAARTYASYEGWRPTGSSGTFTMTVNDDISYIGLFFAGSGTAVVSYTVGATTTTLPPTDASGAVVVFFDSTNVATVQVVVSDFQGYLANIMLGEFTEIERRMYVGHTPVAYGRVTDRVQGLSESGQFLGNITRRRTNVTRVDIQNVTPSHYKFVLDGFVAASTQQPHYWSYRRSVPQPVLDVDATDQVAWAQVQGNPQVQNQLANGMMSVGWDIVAL